MSESCNEFIFVCEIAQGIDLDLPGIYEWRIEGSGSYIGKSKRLKRRLREYPNNVRKLALNLPYRAGKPTSFRAIHHEMFRAHVDGRPVVFSVIENCPLERLNEREQFWIKSRGSLNR